MPDAKTRDATDAETSQRWYQKLGPGLITGAADDDPSGIATYSQAGAQFGYNVLWTIVFTYPLMVGIQLASARIGRVTGKGLAENFRRFCPPWVVYSLVSLLVIANVINLGADLNAMGDVAALLFGGSKHVFTVAFGLLSLSLQVFLPYQRYVRILKWLTLSLLAYVAVAFSVHVNWTEVALRSVWPAIQWNKEYVTGIVAIFGTTISPYLFFWQAAQEVEEIRRVKADLPLRMAPTQVRTQLRRLKFDTLVGMGFSNLIAMFIIISTAATLHLHGATDIQTTSQAALALKPIAGPAAFFLFALGIIGTGMLALPVLAGSAAFAIASVFKFRHGLDLKPRAGRAFYSVLGVAVLLGIGIGTAQIDPVKALYWAAVINAVMSVPIMVAVMLIATSPRMMGKLTLSFKWRFLGWLATAAMAAATIALFVSFF